MQDEINSRVVALSIRVGVEVTRLTARALEAAIRKYLKSTEQTPEKIPERSPDPVKNEPRHGKQSVGKLMRQNARLTNIEVTDQNIKSFERVARKYNIDFALKKDKAADPPRYLVFFKARDVDVMNAAFREYAGKSLSKAKKPSIRKLLFKSQEKARRMDRERTRQKDRVRER